MSKQQAWPVRGGIFSLPSDHRIHAPRGVDTEPEGASPRGPSERWQAGTWRNSPGSLATRLPIIGAVCCYTGALVATTGLCLSGWGVFGHPSLTVRKYGEGTSEEATPRLLRGLAPLAVEGFGPRKRLVGRKPLKLFACGCLHPNASAWRLGA